MTEILLFFAALVLTVVIECGFVSFFKSKRLVYVVFLCNLLTNPLLNFIILLYYNFIGQNYYILLAVLEVSVVFAETVLICWLTKIPFKNAVLISLIINAASFLAGIAIF